MKRTNLTAVVTSLLAVTVPTISCAEPPTYPVFAVGLLGSYSVLEFTGHRSNHTDHMPEGGIFLNFGNKMTAQSGVVYQAEISGQYSEKQNQKVKDGQAVTGPYTKNLTPSTNTTLISPAAFLSLKPLRATIISSALQSCVLKRESEGH